MFNPGATLYSQAFGSVPASLGFPVYVSSAPTSTTTQGPFGPFQIGQVAVWPNNGVFQLIGLSTAGGILSATWVQLSSSSGTILSINGTAAQITASTSAGTTTLSLPGAITTPGSLTTTTGLTVGTKLNVTTGANTTIGTATLAAGTATVSTSAVDASSIIFVSRNTAGGTTGEISAPVASITPGVSFVIDSTGGSDTSTVNWWIIN